MHLLLLFAASLANIAAVTALQRHPGVTNRATTGYKNGFFLQTGYVVYRLWCLS